MHGQDKKTSPDQLPETSQVRRRFWQNPQTEESLLSYDLESTFAHVAMLGETGIVEKKVAMVVLEGLKSISAELTQGKSYLMPADIDIHQALERRLSELVGESANAIRLAISHNDQIATDVRMWLRDKVLGIFQSLVAIRHELLNLAFRDLEIIMPGYTHMQPAQPILLSQFWLSNEARFRRDFDRLCDLYPRLNALPLGACVLAGNKEPIDRQLVAQYLGFTDVIENSLDAVSDRDFLVEFGAFASLVGVHLCQMSTDLLLWATQEYGFIKLHKSLVFRSLKMPFKKNPELLEVLRCRPSVLHGRLMEFITQMKGLPSGFSQDLQECLPGLSDVVENLMFLLELACTLVSGIDIDAKRMKEVACSDLLNGSNAIQYLIIHGVEGEKAAKVVENLANYCKTRNKFLSDLALNEWQQFSPAFESDVYEYVTMEQSVGAFCSFDGSSKEQVELSLNRSKDWLSQDEKRIPHKVKSLEPFPAQAKALN